MKTRNKLCLLNKTLLLLCVFAFSCVSANASVNFLSGIDVKQVNDNQHNVLLKLNNSVKVQKTSNAKDTLTLTLTDTMPSESIDIVYDNANDIQNVIVQKKNSDNTVIVLQGKNIENAKIFTSDISTGITKEYNTGFLNSLFFLANDNLMTASAVVSFIFLLMFACKPSARRKYNDKNIVSSKVSKNYQTINTLRTQNKVQTRNIPSINYKINRKIASKNTTVPENFVINQYTQKEKVRKAG